MRIDIHVHGALSDLTMSPDQYAERLRAKGIERAGLIGELSEVLAAYRALPDYVIPIPWFDMDTLSPVQIHDALDAGAAGIKFIDPRFSYGDPRYDPLYRAVHDRGKIAVFHTGYLAPEFSRSPSHTDITLMRPAAIDALSRRHPDLKILMAHYGNPWWEEAWKITWSSPNVYADLCGGTAIYRSLNMWRGLFAPNGTLDPVSISKLLFATDDRIFEEAYDPNPFCEFYDELFDAIGASEAQREQVNRGNAIRLFLSDL